MKNKKKTNYLNLQKILLGHLNKQQSYLKKTTQLKT